MIRLPAANDPDASRIPPVSNRKALLTLGGIAVASCGIYLAIALLSHRFRYTAPLPDRPIPLVLMLFGAAFALYVYASWIAARSRATRSMMWLVVGASIVFRCLLIPSTPIQEVDIYRYLWDGAVVTQRVSPFRFAPAQVTAARGAADGDLERLVRLRDSQATMATILRRIHFAHVPTVYPPVSQVVFAAAALTSPATADVRLRLILMKSWFVAFDLATLIILIALLRAIGQPPGLSVLYGWCPLLMKEFANSGHLDAVAVCLTMMALYLLVLALTGETQSHAAIRSKKKHKLPARSMLLATSSTIALGLAIGAKLYPVVLAPLLLGLLKKRLGTTGFVGAATVLVAVTLLVMSPMMPGRPVASVASTGPQTSDLGIPIPPREPSELLPINPSQGLTTFLRSWEMNDFLFLIVVENLKPDWAVPGRQPWFAIVPNDMRTHLLAALPPWLGDSMPERAFMITRVLMALMFLPLLVWWVRRAAGSADPRQWLECAFLTVAWFWLLCPTQNPWYWTWAVPLLPFARSRIWWLMSGLVLTYYLRFWLWYEFAESPILGTSYKGPEFFDFVVTWLEYAPWMVSLAAGYVCAVARRRQINEAVRFVAALQRPHPAEWR